jgi:hypothetical protein
MFYEKYIWTADHVNTTELYLDPDSSPEPNPDLNLNSNPDPRHWIVKPNNIICCLLSMTPFLVVRVLRAEFQSPHSFDMLFQNTVRLLRILTT